MVQARSTVVVSHVYTNHQWYRHGSQVWHMCIPTTHGTGTVHRCVTSVYQPLMVQTRSTQLWHTCIPTTNGTGTVHRCGTSIYQPSMVQTVHIWCCTSVYQPPMIQTQPTSGVAQVYTNHQWYRHGPHLVWHKYIPTTHGTDSPHLVLHKCIPTTHDTDTVHIWFGTSVYQPPMIQTHCLQQAWHSNFKVGV